MALLQVRNVSRRFGDFVAVDNVSFNVEAGEFFTLLGPSGCGKTTLLRMIAGFDAPDGGSILLDGVDLADQPPERRPVRTVFQSYALFPHMTVTGNVAFPLQMSGTASADIPAKVRAALEGVRLTGFEQRYPHELSGGQKQRVAIARALVTHPPLLLLDEPLAALDAKLREEMQVELIELQKDVGIAFIYVTHDQSEALALSSRIAVMNRGHIEQIGDPASIYSAPETRFVADFIGTCNLLEGHARATEGNDLTVDIPDLGEVRAASRAPVVEGSNIAIALRPEKIHVSRSVPPSLQRNRFTGTVTSNLYMGDVTVYLVTTERGRQIEALLANSEPGRSKMFDVGERVELAWPVDAGHVITR
ncbi:MAG TPA: ABC transporter ATP-binding protein [Casimicrobiaceae bacterium]|nr:ABC transporter ATP-binding protein [Casimicrobiaceae bacterium]